MNHRLGSSRIIRTAARRVGPPLAIVLALAVSARLLVAEAVEPAGSTRKFVHPGLLHTQADLDRMRRHVAAGDEPWKAGFARLEADKFSRADYRRQGPFEVVIRETGNTVGNGEMVADANAAYQNAIMWRLTGNEAHARKAIEILNAWSSTLREMRGHDVQLAAGLNGFKFVNAAELMRDDSPTSPWPPDASERFRQMLRRAIYPPLKDFATFANGNWDAACMKTLIAIGVFCDDPALVDRVADYFRRGQGNGRITHYVINPAGQCQESGRDQQHAQLGLGLLAETCEVAWNQGIDLYGEVDNRLLAGFEYTARYNLGHDMPFVATVDVTGKYRHKRISEEGRGELRPIYEMAWNHYHRRRGLDAPFIGEAAAKLRPEGPAFSADHPGFGTLLFSRPADSAK